MATCRRSARSRRRTCSGWPRSTWSASAARSACSSPRGRPSTPRRRLPRCCTEALRRLLLWQEMMLADVLLHPKFAAKEFERKKAEALAELESEEQNPGALADRAFRKALYGKGPYRSSPGGWKESVGKLSVADVKDFYKAAYRPDR